MTAAAAATQAPVLHLRLDGFEGPLDPAALRAARDAPFATAAA